MERLRSNERLQRTAHAILAVLFVIGAFPAGTHAVSRFSVHRDPGQEPAAIDFEAIWFYDEDRSRQIPDVSLKWIAAAWNAGFWDPAQLAPEGKTGGSDILLSKAKEIAQAYEEIVDVLYDPNLTEDGCFFALRDGLGEAQIKDLVRELDKEEWIAYAHPTLVVQGKTLAFFNAFQMQWKKAADDASRQELIDQAHVSFEAPEEIYRVDVLSMPFFRAVNLLAEDVRVSHVTPYFVPLETTIRVDMSVPLQGCQIGDSIPFSLRIDFSDRIRIDPSSLVNINLRPGEIQKELFDLKLDPYDYVKAASQSPLILTGWLKIYSPGEFVIPAVEIQYECTTCSGEPVRSIRSEEIPVKVASLVPSKGAQAKLAVPVDNVSPLLPTDKLREEARNSLWEAVASFVIAAALLGWAGKKGVYVIRESRREPAERREDALAESLRSYLAQASSAPHWQVAAEAGGQLREYLVTKYGLDRDPRQGSGDVFFEGVKERVPGLVAGRLRPLLQEIDRLIAMEKAEYPELERWKSDTLELVHLAQSTER